MAFFIGWTVNGWRLGETIKGLEVVKTDNEILRKSIQAQNESIKKLESEAHKKRVAANEAVKIATESNKKLESQLLILRQSRGENCQDAENLINETLGL